jgi:outer membrane protein assembly factor BamB
MFYDSDVLYYKEMKPILRGFQAAALFFFAAGLSAQSGPSADRERGRITADPAWRQALGGAVTGLPAVQAQSAVVALDGGNIRAFSAAGTPLWNFSARGRISPFVTRSREGVSYISRTNGALIAVNRAGRELWRRGPGGPLSGPVISGWDGRLFVPTGKKISCYTASGNLLWARFFDHAIGLSPRLDQSGGMLLALENAEALRIDPFGGINSWKLSSVPRVLLSIGGGRIMALHRNGAVEILGSAEDWYFPAEADSSPITRLPSPPLAAASRGSRAAVVLDNGQTLLLSWDERKILWTGESHIRVLGTRGGTEHEAAVIYDERGIYVLSGSGVTAFSEDGRRLWFTTLENTAAIPAIGDDGVLYSGGQDWILYAYKLEERDQKRHKQSLYGPAPEGSYGTGSPPPSPWADYHFRFDETELQTRLDSIGRAVLAGVVGQNELAWTAWLMETAAGDYGPAASITHPAVHTRYRVRALGLLAQIGSRETIPYLANIFRKDVEPVIRAAAAEAIGAIGVDNEGAAIQAFFETVSPGGTRNEQVLFAVASGTGALCRFSGPPLSDIGVKILTLLAAPGQAPIVQQQARRELASLRQ